MNYSIILRFLGIIQAAMALVFFICLGLAFVNASTANIINWIICVGVVSLASVICYSVGKGGDYQMFRKEALAVIGLSWINASIMGALPYLLILDCSLVDALFESTSGLTTTGASVFSNLEDFPESLMLWRCMSQWIGGLGVVVFFVAILTFSGGKAKILYTHESSAKANDLESSRIQDGVLKILGIYVFLSIACAISYRIAGMSWYDALCHMLTTVSTGGFSTHSDSFAYFGNPYIEWTCIVFMIIGGTSFIAVFHVLRFKWKKDFIRNDEICFYLAIIFSATCFLVILSLTNAEGENWQVIARDSAFQVTAIMTGTGYSSANSNLWMPAAHVLLFALMIIGGCSGSTSGGLKVIRIVVAIKCCIAHIEKVFNPRVIRPIRVNSGICDEKTRENNQLYIVMVGAICLALLPLIAFMEPAMSLEGVASCVFATIFNVGPGFAEVGVNNTYALLQGHTKLLLSLIMIIGRLEFYAILVLLVPSFWRNF